MHPHMPARYTLPVMETTGCGTAIVTPFRADGSIDEAALRALVNWQIDSGIDFIVACGSTGEAATLDEDEWLHAVHIVVDAAAGRVPVWAGCTHNSTRTLLRQAALLRQVRGVDAILSANPYYNKPTQEGQFQHFLALAKAVDPDAGVSLQRARPHRRQPRSARPWSGWPRPRPISRPSRKPAASCPRFPSSSFAAARFQEFSPATTTWRLAAIGVGAHGLISVAANEVPAEVARMVRAALRNNWAEARELERRFGRLFEANFWESNPAPVKTVLTLMGRATTCRLPLVPPSAATRAPRTAGRRTRPAEVCGARRRHAHVLELATAADPQ